MRFPIDRYADNLMLSVEELRAKKVDEQSINRIIRLRDVYNYMLRTPMKKDKEYVDYIMAQYKGPGGEELKRRTAYEDLEILHAVVGNLQNCSKEWHRWRFNNMIMEGYAIAMRMNDANAIAKLAQQYGKYNQLDKADERDCGYEAIPRIVFTFDVSVLGFTPIPNVRRVIDETIARYSHSRLNEIVEDAEILEITEASKELPIEKRTADGLPTTVCE